MKKKSNCSLVGDRWEDPGPVAAASAPDKLKLGSPRRSFQMPTGLFYSSSSPSAFWEPGGPWDPFWRVHGVITTLVITWGALRLFKLFSQDHRVGLFRAAHAGGSDAAGTHTRVLFSVKICSLLVFPKVHIGSYHLHKLSSLELAIIL